DGCHCLARALGLQPSPTRRCSDLEPGMAVRVKARSSALYEQDLYAWSEAQAELLRRRRFAELDLEHVIQEIEDVGGSLYREVRRSEEHTSELQSREDLVCRLLLAT